MSTNNNTVKNNNMTKFLCLIIGAVVLVAAVAVGIFFATRGGSNDNEYLPKDYYGEPNGLDEDHTARY